MWEGGLRQAIKDEKSKGKGCSKGHAAPATHPKAPERTPARLRKREGLPEAQGLWVRPQPQRPREAAGQIKTNTHLRDATIHCLLGGRALRTCRGSGGGGGGGQRGYKSW